MTPIRRFICGIFWLLLISSHAHAGIYRWIDENGQVRFSDAPPPSAAKLERHVLDQQGNLRDVLKRQRTLEELALHRKRLAAQRTEQQRRDAQDKYDLYLWTTFSSLQQLESLRDERLRDRTQQIEQNDKKIAALEAAIDSEREKKAASALAQQNLLRSLQNDMEQLRANKSELLALRQQEFADLNQDITRYEYLRLKRAMNQTR